MERILGPIEQVREREGDAPDGWRSDERRRAFCRREE
jgi:hypothetical protein